MASTTFPGLLSTDKKRAFAIQLGGDQQPVEDDPSTTGVNLPANVFSNVPKGPVAQPGTVATPELKDFAFNPKYAQQDQTLRRKLSDAGYQRVAQQQDVNDTYDRTVNEAERQKTDALQRLMESMSSRGLATSGINLQEQGRTTEAYQRYLDNLSNERAKALAGIEGAYSGTINDIASAREAMYLQQVQEEEAARLEQERVAAEAQARQMEADRQAQLMQELIAAQEAAQAAYVAPSIPAVSMPSIGVSAPVYSPPAAAQPAQQAQYQNLQGMDVNKILKSNDKAALQSWASNSNLPSVLRLAAEARLRTLTNPTASQKQAATSVGTSAANLLKGLFK